MDGTRYLPAIFLGLLILGLLYSLVRLAGEIALIRAGDRDMGASIWQVWKDWRRGGLVGWTAALWRLALVNILVFLAALPAAAVSLACLSLALGGSVFSSQPVPAERLLVAVLVAVVLLAILSIPGMAVAGYVRLVQRAVVLEELNVRAALLRGAQIVRCCFRDMFILWLVLGTLQLLYALVILPLISFLSVTALVLGWISGAGVYFVIERLVMPQTAFASAAILGGLVFLAILYLPMSFVDGLMATYVSVSWTRGYRQMAAAIQNSEPAV